MLGALTTAEHRQRAGRLQLYWRPLGNDARRVRAPRSYGPTVAFQFLRGPREQHSEILFMKSLDELT